MGLIKPEALPDDSIIPGTKIVVTIKKDKKKTQIETNT